jgi:mycothiol synthase
VSVELRPPQREDADALAAMFERFGSTYGADLESVTDIEAWFDNPGADMERDARVALLDGTIVGYADASDAARDGKFVYLDMRSESAHRGDAEPALLDFVEHRARDLAVRGGVIKVWAPKDAEELRRLIEARGFAFDSYSFRMGIDLTEEPPEPVWPAGITVRSFRRDQDTETVYEAHQEAFSEEPDHFRDPFDEWQHWSFRDGFDPALWFLAEDGDELAGISLCRPERAGGRDVGFVHALAVLKPWRRRGLALALLLHSFHEFRRRGKRRAGLAVHGINTNALRLYEKAEMAVERTSAWYRKEV